MKKRTDDKDDGHSVNVKCLELTPNTPNTERDISTQRLYYYAYSTANRTRTITYPSGRVIIEQKDLRDRLTTVSDTGGVIAGYSYDNANRVQTREYANGVVADYDYDTLNRITGLSHSVGQASLLAFQYAYVLRTFFRS